MDLVGRWIPLNFVYLAGSARLAGVDAEIYDAIAKNHGYREIEQALLDSEASYVAISAITSTIDASIKILELARRINPRVITILGGIHPTFCYEEVFNSTSAVDYIICGPGEATLRELLQTLESSSGRVEDIPGLVFRRNGNIVKSSKRLFSGSIDDLPTAWDLLDWKEYKYFVIPCSRLAAITTSRALDHESIFSPGTAFREEYRSHRDPRKVVEEIGHLYEAFGPDLFLITDEYPASNRERWELFLDLLIERNLPITFLMQSSAADIVRDRDIIRKYRKAGVIHIYINMGAKDLAAPDLTGNGTDLPESKVALDIIREQGMISEASFVLGGPRETKRSVEQTFRVAQYCNPDNAQFLPFTPWPYDHTYDEVRQYIRVNDYSKYNLIDPVMEPEGMSLLQMDVSIVDCYRRFYMNKMPEVMGMKEGFKRRYLMGAMKLIMGSPFILRKLGMGTLGKIPAKIGEMFGKKT